MIKRCSSKNITISLYNTPCVTAENASVPNVREFLDSFENIWPTVVKQSNKPALSYHGV